MMSEEIAKRRQGSEEGGEPRLTVLNARGELEKLLERPGMQERGLGSFSELLEA